MGEPELWQVYDSKGGPVPGKGAVAAEFSNDATLFMANSHVWLQRDLNAERHILLQRRALHLPRKPGCLHASASGHVNLGEDAKTTAIRETSEELGVQLAVADLTEAFVLLGGSRLESFNHVFTVLVDENFRANINEREVDAIFWVPVAEFDDMRKSPEEHELIDLGQEYYDKLVRALLMNI